MNNIVIASCPLQIQINDITMEFYGLIIILSTDDDETNTEKNKEPHTHTHSNQINSEWNVIEMCDEVTVRCMER